MQQRPKPGAEFTTTGGAPSPGLVAAQTTLGQFPTPGQAAPVASHYELLGLRPYEADPAQLRSAFERKQAELLQLQGQIPPNLLQRYAFDLQAAQQDLLDPARKQAYDLQLLYAGGKLTAATPQRGTRAAAGNSVHACPRCGWQNTADREFCGGCGVPLWEPCLGCGVTLGVWEKFCGSCGSNVVALFQERSIEFRQKLQQAASLAQIERLEEAVVLLEPIVGYEHPRLGELLQRVRADHIRYKAQLEQLSEFSGQAVSQAHEAAHQRNWLQAATLLERIPANRRGAGAVKLLEECKANLARIETLREQVRQAIEAKQAGKILPWLEELMNLQPQEAAWPQLAAKVQQAEEKRRQQVCELSVTAAEKEIVKKNFSAAVAILQKVPAEARKPAWDRAHEQATALVNEIAFLKAHVGSRVALDAHYPIILERLVQMQPADLGLARQLMQLKSQLEQREKAGKGKPTTWSGKEYPADGLPTKVAVVPNWLALKPAEGFDNPDFSENAGAYAAAVGLALHALGRGMPRFSFHEQDNSSGLMGMFGRKERPTASAWGIDVGSAGVKAVLLEASEEDGSLTLAEAWRAETEELALTTDPNKSNEIRNELVGKFVEEFQLDAAEKTCVGFNGQELLLRSFTVPAKAVGKMLINLIQLEAKKQIPFPLEHTIWKYEVGPAPDSTTSEQEVRLYAAKKAIIMQALDPWHRRKLKVHHVQSTATGLHHLARYLQHKRGENDTSPCALLDVGHQETLLVVSQGSRFWHRGISHGGMAFDRAVTRDLGYTREQALRLRHQPHTAELLHPLFNSWGTLAGQLRSEIARSLAYVSQNFRHGELQRIYLAGNCLRLHGLLEHLIRSHAPIDSEG